MTAVHNPTGRPTKDVRKQAEQCEPKTPTDVSGMSAGEIGGLLYELKVPQQDIPRDSHDLVQIGEALEG